MQTDELKPQEQPRAYSRYDLDTVAAAAYLLLRPNTLALWRSQKRQAIPFVKVGRKILYSRADLDQWLETRRGTEPNKQRKPRRVSAKSQLKA
jgi:excisionase family DNA binding protein